MQQTQQKTYKNNYRNILLDTAMTHLEMPSYPVTLMYM